MDRNELKAQFDEVMRQYDEEEIDGDIYKQKMWDLIIAQRNEEVEN